MNHARAAIIAEAHPTPVPAPDRVAHDRRSRADALFADMLREEASAYVLGLRIRAGVLVRR